jgi:hypothetical protein
VVKSVEASAQSGAGDGDNIADIGEVGPGGRTGGPSTAAVDGFGVEAVKDGAGDGQRVAEGE